MRLPDPFVYRMTNLGKAQVIFDFIHKAANMEMR